MKLNYLHIPKTAGTALKNAFIDNQLSPFNIASTHNLRLTDGVDIVFCVRDPWRRFCSAYWERRTNPQRKRLNARAPQQYQRGGYVDLSTSEQELFEKYPTPNDLLTFIKKEPQEWNIFLCMNPICEQLFRPLSWYLGTVEEFKQQQHRIAMVIPQPRLNLVMKNHFNIDMPTNPFLARNREQFDIPQSYTIGDENIDFFENMYKTDFELIAYIKTQPYFTQE